MTVFWSKAMLLSPGPLSPGESSYLVGDKSACTAFQLSPVFLWPSPISVSASKVCGYTAFLVEMNLINWSHSHQSHSLFSPSLHWPSFTSKGSFSEEEEGHILVILMELANGYSLSQQKAHLPFQKKRTRIIHSSSILNGHPQDWLRLCVLLEKLSILCH